MIDTKTPFNIGKLELKHRLIQAPLAGISCAPFRALFSHFELPAYAVTEMISAQSLLQHERLKPRYLARSSNEGPLGIQLSGNDPDVLSKAVAIAESYQPEIIDLNCGCPQPKIRGKGCGSALVESKTSFQQTLKAIRAATSLPFTVKIRTAGNTSDHSYLETARMIEQCGADAIIVHGRHFSEDYDVPANYAQIRQVVESVAIPVIANGDVCDRASMLRCLEETGAAAIMIARGSIGAPWLFQQLLQNTSSPSLIERLNLFQIHIQELSILEESTHIALLQGRRLLKWYFPELSNDLLSKCYELIALDEVMKVLYFCVNNNQ